MIAMTSKNGKCVRLSADFQIDVGEVWYSVKCGEYTFEFGDFAPAAHVYRTLSYRIESDENIDTLLGNLVRGARAMGYTVFYTKGNIEKEVK